MARAVSPCEAALTGRIVPSPSRISRPSEPFSRNAINLLVMSDPSRDPDDAEELAALVSELETTLSDLRVELGEHERADDRDDRGANDRDRRPAADRWDRRGRGRSPPRPPAPGELFRFTSDYTIPTVVAVLEATIETLELLRGVIDLAAPGEAPADRRRGRGSRRTRRDARGLARSVFSDALGEGVTAATDRAATDAADALERLRETLSEADLPEDEGSRDLVADARELSAELERRVRESREVVDRERDRERRAGRGPRADREPRTDHGHDDGPVTIEVGDPDEPGDDGDDASEGDSGDAGRDADNETTDADGGDPHPEVDVDSELESIKRELQDDADDRAADAADADGSDENSVDGDDNGNGADAADGDDSDGSSGRD